MNHKRWFSTFYFTPKKPGARTFEIDYSTKEPPLQQMTKPYTKIFNFQFLFIVENLHQPKKSFPQTQVKNLLKWPKRVGS